MEAEMKETILDFLDHKVRHCSVLVLGDVMLDRYFYGDVLRISPEAPVPVNRVSEKKDTLGGAANVAHNLARLGAQVKLIGLIGDDHHGRVFARKLKKAGIDGSGVYKGREKTTTKIRVLGGHQQMIRLDFEETESIASDVEPVLLKNVQHALVDGVQAVILSDYGKGMCTDTLCQGAIAMAKEHHIPVIIDPKGTKWDKYAGASYITPNVKETATVLGEAVRNENEALQQAAATIRERYHVPQVMITRSEKGISLFSEDDAIHIPTMAQEVFDVSGAGDTVISAFTAALCAGMPISSAIYFANYAAGIEVGRLGTYAVSAEDIRCHIQ